jgi:hypothetical protein
VQPRIVPGVCDDGPSRIHEEGRQAGEEVLWGPDEDGSDETRGGKPQGRFLNGVVVSLGEDDRSERPGDPGASMVNEIHGFFS